MKPFQQNLLCANALLWFREILFPGYLVVAMFVNFKLILDPSLTKLEVHHQVIVIHIHIGFMISVHWLYIYLVMAPFADFISILKQ